MMDPRLRTWILAPFALLALWFSAPWPGLQTILQVLLVLGIAPAFRSPLATVLWACAAGWVAESALSLYPRLGGTPLANMTLALLALGLRFLWQPGSLTPFWIRMGILTGLWTLASHGAVSFAGGSHPWGTAWLWALGATPIWGTLAWQLQKQPLRK